MLDYLKQRVAAWKWKRSPIGGALNIHTRHYFYGDTALASFKQENKEKLIMDFFGKVGAIGTGPNPIMACREALAEYTLLFAQLQVLCLKESEKAAQFYSDNPYVSGQLWRHVREAADHSDELARIKWETPDLTDEDLIDVANTRCALLLYYANGLNMVRMELGDMSEEKDWFRPFVEACLVNEEHLMREQLDLPTIIPGPLGSLVYATFLNYVVDGEQHPFFAWTRNFPDTYLAGEGPPPKLASTAA